MCCINTDYNVSWISLRFLSYIVREYFTSEETKKLFYRLASSAGHIFVTLCFVHPHAYFLFSILVSWGEEDI